MIGEFDKVSSVKFLFAFDAQKPRKDKIPLDESSSVPRSDEFVAILDPETGIRCPERDSSGQFVYPADCKFYVNCHNGRAFLQSCAPGTLFSPDSLECDFPDKVKCFAGAGNADFFSGEETRSSEPKVRDFILTFGDRFS